MIYEDSSWDNTWGVDPSGGGGGPTTTDVDLSTWTIATDTESVILSRSSTNVEIDDVNINTVFAKWARLDGPLITAGTHEFTIVRTNAGQLDKCGLAIGWFNHGDNTSISFGPFETAGNREAFGNNHTNILTGVGSAISATVVGCRISFFVSPALNTPRQFIASMINSAGEVVFNKTLGTNDNETALSGARLCVYVRHGTAGVGSSSNFNYRIKHTLHTLVTP